MILSNREARSRLDAILTREEQDIEDAREYRRVRNPLFVEARELSGIYGRFLNGLPVSKVEKQWLMQRGPKYGFGIRRPASVE